MADHLCLFNLDTGDFIDLGKEFWHKAPVPEVGFPGSHFLASGIPSIFHKSDYNKWPQEEWHLEHQRTNGHALNAFLTASLGCRLIVVNINFIIDEIGCLADEIAGKDFMRIETNGYLNQSEPGGSLRDDEGNEISEAENFFRRRLEGLEKRTPGYQPVDGADAERVEQKKAHYLEEIRRALKKNIVRKMTGGRTYKDDPELGWVFCMGQQPAEPTLERYDPSAKDEK